MCFAWTLALGTLPLHILQALPPGRVTIPNSLTSSLVTTCQAKLVPRCKNSDIHRPSHSLLQQERKTPAMLRSYERLMPPLPTAPLVFLAGSAVLLRGERQLSGTGRSGFLPRLTRNGLCGSKVVIKIPPLAPIFICLECNQSARVRRPQLAPHS